MSAAQACVSHDRGPAPRPRRYRARRPESTPLYPVVQHHFESWLALKHTGDPFENTVPAFVERDFRKYLDCGIFARGFGRARCPRCGHDFLVAFSCRARAVCPSCNARRMAETAAHLVDHVFPPLPVRQWVLSVPKRLRYFLQREPTAVNAVLHILLRSVEAALRAHSPGAGARARLGAVSFVHRFGSALNPHVHFHCCVLDGVFEAEPESDEQFTFREAVGLSDQAVAAVQAQVRRRVLCGFVRRAWLTDEQRQEMQRWAHSGGFSIDAAVRIEGWDRGGLERLLRYCARPPFALERLEAIGTDRLVYHLPKPGPDGRTDLMLTPLELIDRLAALIPPPRLHRHRYHGVLAPNAPLRAALTALARDTPATPDPSAVAESVGGEEHRRSPARYLWAMLIARIYEVFPLVCRHCGAEMRIIAFVTETASVTRILQHIGEPTKAPVLSPARGPPAWDDGFDQTAVFDPAAAAPQPVFEFDQTATW
jgi:hypothetical protein